MGNANSSPSRSKRAGLFDRGAAPPPLNNANTPNKAQHDALLPPTHTSSCPAASLLETINLGIYTDAFLLAGYGGGSNSSGSSSASAAEHLATLTPADLQRISLLSKCPILEHHQSRILAASKQLALTLGITPAASAQAGLAAAPEPGHAADGQLQAEQTVSASPPAGSSPVSSHASPAQVQRQLEQQQKQQEQQQQQDTSRDDSNPFLPDLNPFRAGGDDASPVPKTEPDGGSSSAGPSKPPPLLLQLGEPPAAGESQASTPAASTSGRLPGMGGGTAAPAPAAPAEVGPLSRSRAQLLRHSTTTLSSPAVTAAAAAAQLAERRRHSSMAQHSRAWDKLPDEVAEVSYAATASLKSHPLPATRATAECKSQHGAAEAEPGVLTLHASQLSQRSVSESGFSMHSAAAGRYPGLRAEKSRASAAATMRQLAQQQASTQAQISRLLQANAAAGGGVAAAGAAADAVPELDQVRSSHSIGHGVLLPEASGYSSALGGVRNSLVLVQQQPPPQLFAHCSSSTGGFLAPVAVAAFSNSNTLQLSPARQLHTAAWQQPQQQQQQQQFFALPTQQGLVLLQEGISAAGVAHAAGPRSTAQSCHELGSVRAADVSNIVQRAKNKAAARQLLQQQQLEQQKQQFLQRHPLRTSVHTHLSGRDDGRQQKPQGAAAMLLGGTGRPPAHTAARGAASRYAHMQPQPGASAAAVAAVSRAQAAAPAPSGSSSSLAAAVRDGDRVLSMLQEYKELTQLDKAVKSRMHAARLAMADNKEHLVGGCSSSSCQSPAQPAQVPAAAEAAQPCLPAGDSGADASKAAGDQAAIPDKLPPLGAQSAAGMQSDQQQQSHAAAALFAAAPHLPAAMGLMVGRSSDSAAVAALVAAVAAGPTTHP